jgi:hypothetical protein
MQQIAEVKPMIRSSVVPVAILCALAVVPAAAADYPYRGPYVDVAPVNAWAVEPFYVVDQGPQLSGPGIMITHIGLKWTGVRRHYPFVATYQDFARIESRPDYYGVMPANHVLVARSRRAPHARGRYVVRAKVTHRKPPKAYRPK